MRSGISIVVPTYKEAGNVPVLISRLDAVRRAHDLEMELILADDDSRDGTDLAVAQAAAPWVRLIVRTTDRGLSPAVLHGLREARYDCFVVMDADLSHPPEKIPEMLAALDAGADFVIGSRYVPGGSTDAAWGLFRWLNSKVATWLARPFTSAHDPMAGFFALRRSTFEKGVDFNPIGYKIGLELLVKCRCRTVVEVPIDFADRKIGESKLNLAEQLKYLQHLRRLFIFKYPTLSNLLQFGIVGAIGTVVNLVVLTALTRLGVSDAVAIGVAIVVSFLGNFALNRRFTFGYARHAPLLRHFVGFAGASALGLLTNYAVAVAFRSRIPNVSIQAAALAGIVAGMGLNYVMSRYFVFRHPVKA
ncbi:MAG: glycosyltransferase family 2 protein [Polyangiaceae bacterium]